MNNRDFRQKPKGKRDHAKPADRPARLPGNQLWLFGTHAVLAALANPARKVRRIVATAEALKTHAPGIMKSRAQRPLPGEEVMDRRDLDSLLPPGAVHQGIAALVEHLDSPGIEDIARLAQGRDHAVVMLLDQVTDPHNVGAILRSAAAFGALAVVVPDRHSPEETGTLAKSASGALEVMPLVRVTNMVRALEQLKDAGFWTAGLAGEATQTIAQAKLTGKIALVMGAEGEGLRRLTREHCDHLVKLPISPLVESLNVSNAAAIALYELARDQDLAGQPASH
ncbi:MAG: 23S rRNA (guanosine(2251)-2'-O)-methyltransferase RlmB [Magnetospirillum sp.]|nr:23S rRNA (guanosine(2251)-2'-O)-methyltransferase RlmB [Magnetospirillum sp.]